MVTVTYTQDDRHFLMAVTGHAGAAPAGRDVVCSAVSILALTACQCAYDLYQKGRLEKLPNVHYDSGSALIEAVAETEQVEAVRGTFETVLTGFGLLQQEFSQFVTIQESSPQ